MVSNYLKSKRETAKLSQKQVAEELGYSSPQFVSNWERGQSTPPIHTIKKLSKIYGFDIKEFQKIYIESEVNRTVSDLNKRFAKVS